MRIKLLLLASSLVLGATLAMSVVDVVKVQCKVIWLFGIPCREAFLALVNQIKAWRTAETCPTGGETCLYELISATPNMIKAKHTSPRTKYVDDLQFILYPAEEATMCRVMGDSTSEAWIDFVDNSTNFCSLQNLIDGSGLSKSKGYKQYSSEYICLGFSTARCSLA